MSTPPLESSYTSDTQRFRSWDFWTKGSPNRKRSLILELSTKVFHVERYQKKCAVLVARVSVTHQSGLYPGSEDFVRVHVDQKALQTEDGTTSRQETRSDHNHQMRDQMYARQVRN